MSEPSAELTAIVRSRVRELRSKPFPELAALPVREVRKIDIAGKRGDLNTYRVNHSPDELLIVVQAYRANFLGFGEQLHAEGFVVSSAGKTTDATEQLLEDYV